MFPDLQDGITFLNRYTDQDITAHIAGEDEETARRFAWWPKTSTPGGVRDALARWERKWETADPNRNLAFREAVWSHLKRSQADLAKRNITQLTALVKTRLRRMQNRPRLLDGCLAKTGLDLTPFRDARN